jgi:hypothetical protein
MFLGIKIPFESTKENSLEAFYQNSLDFISIGLAFFQGKIRSGEYQ